MELRELIDPHALVRHGYCPSCRQFYPHLVHVYLQWYCKSSGNAVAQWLRCCATDRKVTGSISASVRGFFTDTSTMALGSNQPLNRNEYQEHLLGVKAAGV